MHMRFGIVATLAACTGLTAQDYFIVGPRSLGMGGTGVAVADDQVSRGVFVARLLSLRPRMTDHVSSWR